jgi:hypothetical protein
MGLSSEAYRSLEILSRKGNDSAESTINCAGSAKSVKGAEGHSRSLIKEKSHRAIRKKKLKGLRATGQTSSIQKQFINNTIKIKIN